MTTLRRYRGSRPLAVPRETVAHAVGLLRDHGLEASLRETLSASAASFDLFEDGSFEGARPARAPRNFQPGADVALDAATINGFKEVMHSAGLHERERFAADVVGLPAGKCPPPTYKCPKGR